ncbi:hypothetical protein TSYNTROPHJE_01680 [Tepidanaerobacter syntrophicus]|uniref:UvrD-helicase domain-containing protein n=1 Tax=Tepidanaerobacter syntrophicus TaxID=224999 RepID=UPI0022EFCA77|nr:UvrD-helicase domain-containing protein [Tepidanaerobacter syntrophicus]GLI18355.1 hypothetical protein TSYNTROPHJE_01680 [Tepidanaerobacter syntrophicus]
MEELRSNVTLKSNVYPVKEKFAIYDEDFVKRVRGKKALDVLTKRLDYFSANWLTPVQLKEIETGTSCYYSPKGELVAGTIKKGGKIIWVRRCENEKCRLLEKCKKDPDFFFIKRVFHPLSATDVSKEKTSDIIEKLVKPSIDDKCETPEHAVKQTTESAAEEVIEGPKHEIHLPEEEKEEISEVDNVVPLFSTPKDVNRDFVVIEDVDEIIKKDIKSKVLVNSGPGSGKTYTLIKRIEYILGNGLASPENLLLLCFSRTAVAEIKERIEYSIQEGLLQEDARLLEPRTFDSYATLVLTAYNVDVTGKDYDERIELFINNIRETPGAFDDAEYFMVDEIQDLVGVRAQMVQEILNDIKCGFMLLGDSCQAIYDYQAKDDPNAIDSKKFYAWLYSKFEDMEKYEINKNVRQVKELKELTAMIRNSILTDPPEKQISKIKETVTRFSDIGYSYSIIKDMLPKDKKIAFLCRNNGEALRTSGELRNNSVIHSLQKQSTSRHLKPWISIVFSDYLDPAIDYTTFAKLVKERLSISDSEDIDRKWTILHDVTETEPGSVLRIDNLVNKLYLGSKFWGELEICERDRITVSTIHRAKGREYDEVFLLTNSLDETYLELDDEAKVYYVALTRPKERIRTFKFKTDGRQYKPNGERWAQVIYRRGRRPFISRIEVGLDSDVNPKSFINMNIFGGELEVLENQRYLRENVYKDDEVRLVFNYEKKYYLIEHNNKIIGALKNDFTQSLRQCINKTNKNPDYPKLIDNIYVDNVITIVDKSVYDFDFMPKQYKQTHLWTGIEISGFGRVEWY